MPLALVSDRVAKRWDIDISRPLYRDMQRCLSLLDLPSFDSFQRGTKEEAIFLAQLSAGKTSHWSPEAHAWVEDPDPFKEWR